MSISLVDSHYLMNHMPTALNSLTQIGFTIIEEGTSYLIQHYWIDCYGKEKLSGWEKVIRH